MVGGVTTFFEVAIFFALVNFIGGAENGLEVGIVIGFRVGFGLGVLEKGFGLGDMFNDVGISGAVVYLSRLGDLNFGNPPLLTFLVFIFMERQEIYILYDD
jgi:hypothetical protein